VSDAFGLLRAVIMPVVNVRVDSRDVWRALNRPDEGNLVAAQGSKRHPLFLPAPVERPGAAIAQTANVLLLHMPLPGMKHLPSFAFVPSPAEIERGPAYEFVLNHVVEVADGTELVRTSMSEVSGA
jgi:hypothetical protein